MEGNYIIEEFDRLSGDEVYEKFTAFTNQMRLERNPGEPAISMEENRANLVNIPPFVIIKILVAWTPDRTEIVGSANAGVFKDMPANEHLAQFGVDVASAHRQKGLGKELFRQMVAWIRDQSRTLMISNTDSRIPAGDLVMEKMGAEMGLESINNRLYIENLDRSLMAEWLAVEPRRASAYTLGMWRGPVPEENLVEYAEMVKVMNSAPRGTLQVEDMDFTPEQVRQMEAQDSATGTQHWIMFARNQTTGELAGFTEIFYHPDRSHRVFQGGTGVLPAHRNHGLGRWLKAAMMETVLAELPEVKYVDTGNANSNAPMLKINTEMGFRHHKTTKVWQISVENAAKYLGL